MHERAGKFHNESSSLFYYRLFRGENAFRVTVFINAVARIYDERRVRSAGGRVANIDRYERGEGERSAL